MKKKAAKDSKKSPNVTTYETEIEYTCPVRGKVKQKVKLQRIDAVDMTVPEIEMRPSKSLADQLDKRYSGLFVDEDNLDEET